MMAKIARILCCFFLILPFVSLMNGETDKVLAQEKQSFFGKLFGRKKTPVSTPSQVNKKSANTRRRSSAPTTRPQSRKAVPKVLVEKSAQAKRILVVGDFVANALAEGLTQNYADNPNLLVIKQVEIASGLVRDDYYNWPAQTAQIIQRHNPDIILVALGGNDRQSFRSGQNSANYGDEIWEQQYQSRINALIKTLQASKHPWIWVGLPPFKKTSLSQSANTFNRLYKDSSEKNAAHFVDIWNGFVDGDGNFSFSGYDVNGQTVRLRHNDGINFTAAGQRKLAFYADVQIQAWLGNTPTILDEEEPEQGVQPKEIQEAQPPVLPVRLQNIERIVPRGLWELDAQESVLTGSHLDKTHPTPSPQVRKFRPQAGRADYFSLTQP